MNNALKYIVVSVLLAAAGCCRLVAQMHPERRHVRAGYKDYETLEYGASEGDFRTAVTKNPLSYEAALNLGDALYRQERFEEAENTFGTLLGNPLLTEKQAAEAFHNLGNAQFGQQKLQEAAESYMKSLMLNPDDLETKYNLAYVQKLLEDQQQDGGGGDNDPNQDQDNDPDQDQSQGGDNDQDPNQDQDRNQDENRDQNQDQGQNEEKPQPDQPREGAMSKADAEKLLEALQQEEDKTREKVNEKQTATSTKSGKNW